jgi:hypothetical protein
MGLINPSPGVVDFEGFRALQPLFDAAKQTGIWVVLRPGMLTRTHHAMVTSDLRQVRISTRRPLQVGYLIGLLRK